MCNIVIINMYSAYHCAIHSFSLHLHLLFIYIYIIICIFYDIFSQHSHTVDIMCKHDSSDINLCPVCMSSDCVFFGFLRYKGEGIVNGSPEKVWDCLKPEINGLRVKWDSNIKKFELLEQVSAVR